MAARLLIALLFLLLPLLDGLWRPARAQDGELGLGMLSFRVSAGYSGFGLPVANWALGREWAAGGDLAWQLAYNYSTVPVLIELEHREAQAFYGRIEIVAEHGYSELEATEQEPVLYSREIIAPPSVPQVFAFSLRSAPPSEIGGFVKLRARLYRSSSSVPLLEQSASYRQLEPAWLYGLYLDDPARGGSDGVYLDMINSGNQLQLNAREGGTDYLGETRLYTLPLRRQQLAAAPLAARNFAFVFADAAALQQWPADEQQALLQYVLAGGYLCLFNAAGDWQGVSLGQGPRQLARGLLLPVAGDFAAARAAATGWIEGELEELTLLCGGTVRGRGVFGRRGSEWFSADFDLDELFRALPAGEYPSHQPQYLHPVWLYRESMRNAALEPWDNPEFSLPASRGQLNANPQLRRALGTSAAGQSLANFTARERRLPPGLVPLAVMLVLAFALWPLRRSARLAQGGLILLLLAAGGILLAKQEPRVSRPLRLELIDREQGLPAASSRLLFAAVADRRGSAEFRLDKNDMLRRVSWEQPGNWSLLEEDGELFWRGSGGGNFLSIAADGLPAELPDSPVQVDVSREQDGMLRIEADASALPQGAICCLLLPLGWTYFEGGGKAVVYTEQPEVGITPGLARLAAWNDFTRRWQRRGSRDRSPMDEQNESLLRSLLGSAAAQRGQSQLARLGMAGITQNPAGYRGMLGNQGLLFIELPLESGGSEERASFMRLSFPLEPGP